MAALLKINGLAAARLFQQHAGTHYADAIQRHPARPHRKPHAALTRAHRILLKAAYVLGEMEANRGLQWQSFMPDNQLAGVREVLKMIERDPLAEALLAPLTVATAYAIGPVSAIQLMNMQFSRFSVH
jgi:hypothetical protein